MSQSAKPAFSRLTSFAISAGPVLAASTIGSLATLPNIPDWYVGLLKPWFTPPNWVFGPVWTALYAAMTLAFYRILRQPAVPGKLLLILAFMAQITLNAAWSVGFFGGRSPLLGLFLIVPLWLAVAATMIMFWRRDRMSGAIFVPYLVWVSFAAALNVEIWRMNG